MHIVGYLNIKSNILWKKSVLGKVYKVNICENEFQIHFPNMPKKFKIVDNRVLLGQPDIIDELKLGKDFVEFGALDTSENDSIIDYVVITGEVNNRNDIKKLYNNIDKWVYSFLNTIKLSKNIIVDKHRVKYISNKLQLFVKEDNYSDSSFLNTSTITISIREQSVGNAYVNKVIKILNDGVSVPEEYEYYIKAVEYFESGKYRNCVLECATAAEMVVTNSMINNCEEKGIQGYMATIKKYNGLESKYDALIFFDDRIQIDVAKISTPRNKAIHSGKKINRDEAKECLSTTKRLLDGYKKFY